MLDKDLQSIQEVRDLVRRAKEAQQEYAQLNQEQMNEILLEATKAALKEAESLAKMAVEETGFGKWKDKLVKNQIASKNLYEHIKELKTLGIINEDKDKGIVEIGTPVGVIGALIPSTNPTSTVIYKSLIALKSEIGRAHV